MICMWIWESAVLGLPSIGLLLAMPNIVIRPAPVRNVGFRSMQSDRVRPKLFRGKCSESAANPPV
jgi:hypothetical protein